jgi:two-component system, OmpR family, alkaline phosphatase synthesis response regulator PhoP
MTKILIIEDAADVRDNVIDILELEGFEVIAASNGLVGLGMAKTEQPDLIICDIMMPEVDGYGVLSQLQQDAATATIPFIFLTAKADILDLRQGMELGADDYLTKPFTPTELRKAIATRLQKQAVIMEQYHQARDHATYCQQQAEASKTLLETQGDFLKNLVLELRNPLSNINMAIQLLEQSDSEENRNRYMKVLREECARELMLINQITQLQELISPDSLKLLHQFKLLH